LTLHLALWCVCVKEEEEEEEEEEVIDPKP
jgi:hypothetical protein